MKIFAGDNSYPASNASYKNLVWENPAVPPDFEMPVIPAVIGNIYTWGPFFRISFDLIVHSLHKEGKGKQGWTTILSFDKKPDITLNKKGKLKIFFEKRKYNFALNIDLNKWYNISIEQKNKKEKVRNRNIIEFDRKNYENQKS